MYNVPPPILSYGRPGNDRHPLDWIVTHRRRILQVLIPLVALLLLALQPYSQTRESTDECILCGASRITTQRWSYHIPLPETALVQPPASGDVPVVFPPHRHIWIPRGADYDATSLLRLLDGDSSVDILMLGIHQPDAAQFFRRSAPVDNLTAVQRGQGWIDIMVGNDTPAARAILAAQPPADVTELRKELSFPYWQNLLGHYHQLPLPLHDPGPAR